MGKQPRVEIKAGSAAVEAAIGEKLGELLTAPVTHAQGEAFQPHITGGAAPTIGPRRPAELPPKPFEPVRNFD